SGLTALFLAFGTGVATAQDVCSDGVGLPPFLAGSVAPNLLLLFDNSASMFDPSYDHHTDPGFCYDTTYISSSLWTVGTVYAAGSIVSENGYWYYTAAGGTAAGTGVAGDTGVTDWALVSTWADDTYYPPGSIIGDSGAWYKTALGGKSDGTSRATDTGVTDWTATPDALAANAWTNGDVYDAGDIVSDSGVLYQTAEGGTATSVDVIANDTGVDWGDPVAYYAGYFDTDTWYVYDDAVDGRFEETTSAAKDAACVPNVGNSIIKYSTDYMCVLIDESTADFHFVTYFAAVGNSLNWLTASKMDQEKEILTGGKYDPMNGNLVVESRGCQGRRMSKEVDVTRSSPGPLLDANGDPVLDGIGDPITTTAYKLTMAARAPETSEKDADLSWREDNTVRIDIFATTTFGFQFGADSVCRDALDEDNYGGMSTQAMDCLELGKNTLPANSNAAYNDSFQMCWFFLTQGIGVDDRVGMEGKCESIYDDGVNPTTIQTSDSGYACMGDSTADPDSSDYGYVGRCWTVGACSAACGAPGVGDGTDDPVSVGGGIYCVEGALEADDSVTPGDTGLAYQQACPPGGAYSAPIKACKIKVGVTWVPTDWVKYCTGGWVADAGVDDGCIEQALIDYCSGWYYSDAIDPSVTTTAVDDDEETDDHFPFLPAILADSALIGQMDEPISTLLGYVEWTAPSVPSALIQEYGNDIRIGAMELNNMGTDTECDLAAAAGELDPSELYDCEDGDRDGGRVITYIDRGTTHTNGLVNAINGIVAETWTPMGEAYYNAIGYYTQNTSAVNANIPHALNAADFFTGGTVSAWAASTYYATGTVVSSGGNYYKAMGAGTSGAAATGPTDDSGVVWSTTTAAPAAWDDTHAYALLDVVQDSDGNFYRAMIAGTSDAAATGPADDTGVSWYPTAYYVKPDEWADDTEYSGGDVVRVGDVLYQTIQGGTSNSATDAFAGDTGVIWTDYYDPVTASCQSNNILIITDGQPTADLNALVTTFVATNHDNDVATVDQDDCGSFHGSTHLDDLTYYAKEDLTYGANEPFVDEDGNTANKEKISTYIV
ncbi:MAG: hypothetical protein KAJ60_04835, partial [Desulfobulbaceae bacterium]|nr:hypothetical protein [Desulfobulbaceae bacterium]